MASEEKNREFVKIIAGILIGISILVFLGILLNSPGYGEKIARQSATRALDPALGINYIPYFIQAAVEFLLAVVTFISSTFILKYREIWRRVLLNTLVTIIIILMIFPIINYYWPALPIELFRGTDQEQIRFMMTSKLMWSYTLSIVLSVFLIFVIVKLSKEEVKLLFK